jgi:hypothetical protein
MRTILFVVCGLVAVTQPIAFGQPRAFGHTVRWDLVQVQQGTALVGGVAVAKHAATGDTFILTGSGEAKPAEGEAAGGGTIVHHFAATGVETTGVYLVTGFIDWQPGGGHLGQIVDGIGHASEASAGVLQMAIRIFGSTGAVIDATLTVNCLLPEATIDVTEGIELSVLGTPFVDMQPDGGATLCHVQK